MPTNINDKLISWGSDIDPGTIRQAEKAARLPIVEGHVALMPDAHVGIGATVGSVIPTKGAVIPSAVGVDIGCGMVAAELDVTEDQLPDTLEPLLGRIEQAIPAGVGKGHDAGGPQRRSVAGRSQAGDRARGRPGGQGSQAVRHARLGQPLLRAVRGRARPGAGWCCTRAAGASATSWPRPISPRPAGWPSEAMLKLEDPDLAYFIQGTAGVRRLHHRHAVGPGLRPGQPGPDDGQRHAARCSRSSASAARPGGSTAITTSPSARSTPAASCG